MTVFGLTITRTKAAPPTLSPVDSRYGTGGWFNIVRESFTGAWQRNVEINRDSVLTYAIVWACITLIASDIAKLWLDLVEKTDDGIWQAIENPAYSPVLRKPNHYQNRIQFIEYWMLSKLIHGNTYVLLGRDNRGGRERGNVVSMYILDPQRVTVLVAPDGSVFYQVKADSISGVEIEETIPASEIIHDRWNTLYHPLVGLSPLTACGLAATQGLKIQHNSAKLFANGSMLAGILTAPGLISNDNARRIEDNWYTTYGGENGLGRVMALGDGLKFEPMTMKAIDAQLIDQLKWTGENVCSAFHVPGWKVGVSPMPAYGNVQAANIEYYSQALQNPIESLEMCLDQGLDTGPDLGTQFDLSALLRMDSLTQMDIAVKGVGGAVYKPNEARALFDLAPVTGGDTPYLQQQNYSLSALDKRDQMAPAPSSSTATPAPQAALPADKAFDEDSALVEWRLKTAALGWAA